MVAIMFYKLGLVAEQSEGYRINHWHKFFTQTLEKNILELTFAV